MRAILIDWLVEVHLKFKLVPESLYLTVNLIDRYLEKERGIREKECKILLLGKYSLRVLTRECVDI